MDRSEKKAPVDDYDITVRELMFEARGKVWIVSRVSRCQFVEYILFAHAALCDLSSTCVFIELLVVTGNGSNENG